MLALALGGCQHHDASSSKAVWLPRMVGAATTANPLVQKWVLPSGATATISIRWKPFPNSEGKATDPGAIASMELATPGWSCVFPKYSFEQLWAPSLRDIRVASLNGDDSDLLLTIPCGDGGEAPIAEVRVRHGELKSAWPIDMTGMSDLFPATEPTPAGMRKRVKLNTP